MIPSRWTYDPSLSTDKDKVRFLIGDTNDLAKLLDDGEIEGILVLEGNAIYAAAATLAESLASRYSTQGFDSISVDGLNVTQTDPAIRFRELAIRLRVKAGLGTPFVGGLSKSEMHSVESDPDRSPSKFRTDQNSDFFLVDNGYVQRDIDPQ